VFRLLTEDVKITHARAVIGFSMRAQQAFQWAVSHPDFADRIVATAGTAKTWPHGIVRLEGQIAALTADPAFNGGDYASTPRKGIEAYGTVSLVPIPSLWGHPAGAGGNPSDRAFLNDRIGRFLAGTPRSAR
jgi:homoserine acetyltransferase